jgi:hypothetical protein
LVLSTPALKLKFSFFLPVRLFGLFASFNSTTVIARLIPDIIQNKLFISKPEVWRRWDFEGAVGGTGHNLAFVSWSWAVLPFRVETSRDFLLLGDADTVGRVR